MARKVRCGLIQAANVKGPESSNKAIKKAMVDKHRRFIKRAADKRVKILCLQELFYAPCFTAEQNPRWFEMAEKIPAGHTIKLMQQLARKYKMVIIAPIFEIEMTGVYYNTAAVIDANGKYLGKYRKNHIPHVAPGLWEKFYFRPGNLGYPVFDTKFARIGISLCYDRHFPETTRILAIKGAEIVFNPNATVSGRTEHIWEIEQPAIAAMNVYFMGVINRVGKEKLWNTGLFYGKSYFCDPNGRIIAQAGRNKEEVLVADLDLKMIQEVRNRWHFFRDRRPETYQEILSK